MSAVYLESLPMNENNTGVQYITISADLAGQRIDNFLRTRLKGVPKSLIYRIVRKGEVRVNKKRVKPEYKLADGDELRIPPVRQSASELAPVSVHLDKVAALADAVLYEDESLLILNKPSGTAVHGGSGLSFGVIEGLRALRPDARFLELVHRLDRDTSGVLLIAKKRSALRALHEQLRMKGMQKDYLALVRGEWPSHNKVVAAPLVKNILASGERIVRVGSEGKPSETRFKVEERFTPRPTLVKASPVTGRYPSNPGACAVCRPSHRLRRSLRRCRLRPAAEGNRPAPVVSPCRRLALRPSGHRGNPAYRSAAGP